MRIHFIAIGGSVMHNLAIALKNKGYDVSGSDDHIYDPARSNLVKNDLLPEKSGFFKVKISKKLDAVILGMHAQAGNPELEKALQLGVKVYSYPEYIYRFSKEKRRVVIAGSHGKTTITSMVMHVLKYWKCDFDYLVGAQLKGFKTNVKLTEEAPVIVIEGDEYFASPIHREPKFLSYRPNIALISGIAWDHVNVFPTFPEYRNQFKKFAETIHRNGTLIYNTEDTDVRKISQNLSTFITKTPYYTPGFKVINHVTYLTRDDKKIPLKIFGEHNLQNLRGARLICNELGINDDDFNKAIEKFEGASSRMEKLNENNEVAVFRDFAHSPSKLKATITAVKNQFSERTLVACMELHTFSSLNKDFLDEYKRTMSDADIPIIYYNPEVLKEKGLARISKPAILKAFQNPDLKVYTAGNKLVEDLKAMDWKNKNLLMMSSGNFDGIKFKELADFIVYKSIKPKPPKEKPEKDKRLFFF